MIFLYYVVIGLVIVLLRSIIFMIKCLRKGITLDTVNKFTFNYIDTDIRSILVGIIIWPIRIITFNMNEKNIIDHCLKYQKDIEELEELEESK